MTIEQARNRALEMLSLMSAGVNPNESMRIEKLARQSLKEAYADYKANKPLKPKTLVGYDHAFNTYINDWHDLPLMSISEQRIKVRHNELTIRSPAQADLCMRIVRAIFNFAKFQYRNAEDNFIFEKKPTEILSNLRLWNNVPRKQSRIYQHDISGWYRALNDLREDADTFAIGVLDFIEITWLTGLRKMELLQLEWHQVDVNAKTFYLDKTKNGCQFLLPMSEHVAAIFARRMQVATSKFVFEANNEYGYIREPKKHIAKLVECSGVHFTLHDLRRTFTSTAELLRVGTYTLKRLINHRTGRNDVTAGYTVLTAEELRSPAQSIENRLLELAGVKADEKGRGLAALVDKMTPLERKKLLELLSIKLAA